MKKFRVVVNGTSYEVEVEEIGQGQNAAASGSGTAPAPVKQAQLVAKAQPASEKQQVTTPKAAPVSTTGTKVEAPMPGTILDIKVKKGDAVSAGDVLMILEAMKMENEISAPQDGTVKEIVVTKGASVNSGDVLIVLE